MRITNIAPMFRQSLEQAGDLSTMHIQITQKEGTKSC